AFRDLDATMVEFNPLVVTSDGQVLALDLKMSFDDNAMFRRPNVAELRDFAQEDPREAEAAEHGLNYVALDGDIGCIINGAGVAQAVHEVRVVVPLVVRLAGTNVDEGRRILTNSGLPIRTADTLSEAAERVVAARQEPA